jgi:hypothetical protein
MPSAGSPRVAGCDRRLHPASSGRQREQFCDTPSCSRGMERHGEVPLRLDASLGLLRRNAGAFPITLGKRGWSAEACCEGIIGGPFAGRYPPPLATFAARLARNSASRNGLALQNLRLYQRHRRHSPHTGPLSPLGCTQPNHCRTASSRTRNLRQEANRHPGLLTSYPSPRGHHRPAGSLPAPGLLS